MLNYIQNVVKDDQKVNNLFNTLGIKVEKISPEETVLRLPVSYALIQGAGLVGGGVLATMADEAMAHCVLAGLKEGQRTATIEMNIRYLRAISEGEIISTARILRKGRTIITTEATVSNAENKTVLAVAGASFWIG